MFYVFKGVLVCLYYYKVDLIFIGFINVKLVNLRLQVNEQLRYSLVKFVIFLVFQICLWCEFVDKISLVYIGILLREE